VAAILSMKAAMGGGRWPAGPTDGSSARPTAVRCDRRPALPTAGTADGWPDPGRRHVGGGRGAQLIWPTTQIAFNSDAVIILVIFELLRGAARPLSDSVLPDFVMVYFLTAIKPINQITSNLAC